MNTVLNHNLLEEVNQGLSTEEAMALSFFFSEFMENSQLNLDSFGSLRVLKCMPDNLKIKILQPAIDKEFSYFRLSLQVQLPQSKTSEELFLWIKVKNPLLISELSIFISQLIREEKDEFIEFFDYFEVVASSFNEVYFERFIYDFEVKDMANHSLSNKISEEINKHILQFIYQVIDGDYPDLHEFIFEHCEDIKKPA